MNPSAILEVAYVENVLQGAIPDGFYKVESMNENGNVDAFYFNNLGGRQLTGEILANSFWTSSIVLNKPDYAHVFYGPLGGGGGDPGDHHRDVRHAVICIPRTVGDLAK
jgi:hypothetical protein